MTLSTTFQSKILKTKKRLSKDHWGISAGIFALVGLMTIVTYCFRTISISHVYGVTDTEIPVLSVVPDDRAFHTFEERPIKKLRKFTPVIVLTRDAFYFGDMISFSTQFTNIRNKHLISHIDGEPQLYTLIESMRKWGENREHQYGTKMDDIAVFIPSGDIPMPIVIQVLAGLNSTEYFDKVILGGGMM